MTTTKKTTTNKTVPVTALSSPATLALSDQSETENQWPVKLQARSKEVLDHWYWGRMVHDFEGMEHKKKIPVDYCHDADQVLGFIDEFITTDYGLELTGLVISVIENDRSSEVALKNKAGIPYEASITFFDDNSQTEYFREGEKVTVNGVELSGPLTVFRKWKLMGVAICPFGYDSNTATEMERRNQSIELSDKGVLEVTKRTQTDSTTESNTDPNATELNNPTIETNSPSQKNGDEINVNLSRSDARTELSQFVERFGSEDGSDYFIENLSMQDCLDKHCVKLQIKLEAAQKTNTDLQAKLDAVELGETTPAPAGETNTKGENKGSTGLESAIKMPGQS